MSDDKSVWLSALRWLALSITLRLYGQYRESLVPNRFAICAFVAWLVVSTFTRSISFGFRARCSKAICNTSLSSFSTLSGPPAFATSLDWSDDTETHAEMSLRHKNIASRDSLSIGSPLIRHFRHTTLSGNAIPPSNVSVSEVVLLLGSTHVQILRQSSSNQSTQPISLTDVVD